MEITGKCRCGAVSYILAMGSLPATYACHCLDCQTSSGSAFGLHALLPEGVITVNGLLVDYANNGAGQVSCQRICPQCHTRLYNTTSAAPGMVVLRAGTLDDSTQINPIAHIWVKRKQAWVWLPDDVPAWPESPTPEAFAQALAKS
ncbi:GFA family protein [Pseudomonas sp. NPDC099000]|uniref:GFA family protein n=1 Tax=Pseudomonas sp. NPDC099000 TaxID=3364488 RepID=UPI00383A7E6D